MSEQLYRIERRYASAGELGVTQHLLTKDTVDKVCVLSPVSPPHDIRWAWERMRDGSDCMWGGMRHRVSNRRLHRAMNGAWSLCHVTWEMIVGGWSEAQENAPQSGTLEWARKYVKNGGAVWKHHPLIKFTANYVEFVNGITEQCPCCQWTTLTGWHPWGDRAWLTALPDGTLVRHAEFGHMKKNGHRLNYAHVDGSIEISTVPDSGWDLVRDGKHRDYGDYSPEEGYAEKSREWLTKMAEAEDKCESVAAGVPHEPLKETVQALAEKSIEHIKDDESTEALIRQQWQQAERIDTLGAQIEQHDHLLSDLAARLARLERKDGER